MFDCLIAIVCTCVCARACVCVYVCVCVRARVLAHARARVIAHACTIARVVRVCVHVLVRGVCPCVQVLMGIS